MLVVAVALETQVQLTPRAFSTGVLQGLATDQSHVHPKDKSAIALTFSALTSRSYADGLHAAKSWGNARDADFSSHVGP